MNLNTPYWVMSQRTAKMGSSSGNRGLSLHIMPSHLYTGMDVCACTFEYTGVQRGFAYVTKKKEKHTCVCKLHICLTHMEKLAAIILNMYVHRW